MMVRTFKKHHRAFHLGYALGRHLKPGRPDHREPKVLVGDPALFERMGDRWNRYTQPHFATVLSFEEEIDDRVATRLVEE